MLGNLAHELPWTGKPNTAHSMLMYAHSPQHDGTVFKRRHVLGLAALTLLFPWRGGQKCDAAALLPPLKFGLTPVFLSNDLELLTKLKDYLSRHTGREVQLVQRRTYEEITALLLSGQLTAAWICGYPLVQYQQELSLVAVPLWKKQPLYSSYLIVATGRTAAGIDDLRGDLHAFSDPNSNSGYLVTTALLAEKGQKPEEFFRNAIFTYGHRNVVRAVASGLAQSGSVDGYVWEVMASMEPELTGRTKVIRKSELLGFPPVACLASQSASSDVLAIRSALLAMLEDTEGRQVLTMLRLDGFAEEPQTLYEPIAAKMRLVRSVTR